MPKDLAAAINLAAAIKQVRARHCQRIAVPGKWKVWRDGDQVKHEVLA